MLAKGRGRWAVSQKPKLIQIIHGIRPVERKDRSIDRSIDLNMCICRNIRPVRVISVALTRYYGCCLTMNISFSFVVL